MMAWLEALMNAGTGGLLGILGSGVSGWLKIKGMKAKAEIDERMMRLQMDAETMKASSADFQASQMLATSENDALIGVAAIAKSKWQVWILVLLHAYKGSVRPNLAVGSHIVAAYVFINLMTPEMQEIVLKQVFTMAFAYGGWYIGNRELNKRIFSE